MASGCRLRTAYVWAVGPEGKRLCGRARVSAGPVASCLFSHLSAQGCGSLSLVSRGQVSASVRVKCSVSFSSCSFSCPSPALPAPVFQLGRCRSVKEFEKLNRIGEGTYGIVCKWPRWASLGAGDCPSRSCVRARSKRSSQGRSCAGSSNPCCNGHQCQPPIPGVAASGADCYSTT